MTAPKHQRYLRFAQTEGIEYARWVGAGGLVVAFYRSNPFDLLSVVATFVAIICFVSNIILRAMLDKPNEEQEGGQK